MLSAVRRPFSADLGPPTAHTAVALYPSRYVAHTWLGLVKLLNSKSIIRICGCKEQLILKYYIKKQILHFLCKFLVEYINYLSFKKKIVKHIYLLMAPYFFLSDFILQLATLFLCVNKHMFNTLHCQCIMHLEYQCKDLAEILCQSSVK